MKYVSVCGLIYIPSIFEIKNQLTVKLKLNVDDEIINPNKLLYPVDIWYTVTPIHKIVYLLFIHQSKNS